MRNTNFIRLLKGQLGITILEMMIAAIITGIIATATFQFYGKMHEQSETQYTVSEMQHLARASLYDIRMSFLQAGYKLDGSHVPYEIIGDTLAIYYSINQPVDTVMYCLNEFTASEYANVPDQPKGVKLYKLVKSVNGSAPATFADYVTEMIYNQLDSANVQVTINIQSMQSDNSYNLNSGFRIYTLSERINVRNLGLGA